MNAFHLSIYEPNGVFYDGKCESLVIPTDTGDFGIMANHENIVCAIVAGIMLVALVACTGNQGGPETGKETGGETAPATESAADRRQDLRRRGPRSCNRKADCGAAGRRHQNQVGSRKRHDSRGALPRDAGALTTQRRTTRAAAKIIGGYGKKYIILHTI